MNGEIKPIFYDGFVIDYGSNEFSLERDVKDYVYSESDSTYIIKSGDTLLDIAKRKYQESRNWWMVMDANPQIVDPFTDLSSMVGKTIIIPNPDFF